MKNSYYKNLVDFIIVRESKYIWIKYIFYNFSVKIKGESSKNNRYRIEL